MPDDPPMTKRPGSPPMGLHEHRVQQLRELLAADPDRFAANGTYMTSVFMVLDAALAAATGRTQTPNLEPAEDDSSDRTDRAEPTLTREQLTHIIESHAAHDPTCQPATDPDHEPCLLHQLAATARTEQDKVRRVVHLAELDRPGVWIRGDTKIIRVEQRRDGYTVTLSAVLVDDIARAIRPSIARTFRTLP